MNLFERALLKLFPLYIKKSYLAWKCLAYEYGQLATMKNWECKDAEGHPIPWYTYPAIDFLRQLDLKQKRIFEFGSGFSTLFWASKGAEVISVEHDPVWYEKINAQIKPNTEILLEPDAEMYTQVLSNQNDVFDIIIIDGIKRYNSAVVAIQKLDKNGFLILDNADWFPNTSHYLRENGLTQIDFIGFSPINEYTFNTAFFVPPNWQVDRLNNSTSPQELIGNIRQRSDEDY